MMYNPYCQLKTIDDVKSILDDDNKLVLPLCKSLITLMSKSIDPYEENYGVVDRDSATVLGLLVKILKCYKECVFFYESGKAEMSIIYDRIIYEAFVKFKYLIRYGTEAQRQYRLISYKNRYDFYKEYKDRSGHLKVRNDKFLSALKEDEFSLDDLEKNKLWKLGGKNFKQLLAEVENEVMYTSLYGIGSDMIHSDWGEIRQFHLLGNEMMCAKVEYYNSHYRYIISLSFIPLDATLAYIDWFEKQFKSDELSFLKEYLLEIRRVMMLICSDVIETYENDSGKYMLE